MKFAENKRVTLDISAANICIIERMMFAGQGNFFLLYKNEMQSNHTSMHIKIA